MTEYVHTFSYDVPTGYLLDVAGAAYHNMSDPSDPTHPYLPYNPFMLPPLSGQHGIANS